MIQNRVLPVLLLDDSKLVKTIKFKNPNYLGDPVNAVKIFNDKEVDELILLDISATKQKRGPNYDKIEEICSEAFMPFAYGGGIQSIDQVKKLFDLGIEKVVLNSVLNYNLDLVSEIASIYGAQSVVASLDFRKNLFGNYQIYTECGKNKVKVKSLEYIESIISAGVGELFVNSIDRDGTFLGLDLSLIEWISERSDLPIVACGGAKDLDNLKEAIGAGASAVAAGSMFVYRGPSRGIMINYPSQEKLSEFIIEG